MKTIKQNHAPASAKNQRGLASIVAVMVLAILISLISLSFTRLMDRAIQQASGNDLSAAADYAARSAINDVAALIKTAPGTPAATHCGDLPLISSIDLSGNGTTKYTCILFDPTPTDIFYQILVPYKSQVTKIIGDKNIEQMMISWQGSDRSFTTFPAGGSGGSSSLLDETAWGTAKNGPVLELTLYPFPTQGSATSAWNYMDAHWKSLFLYPYQAATGAAVTTLDWNSVNNGNSNSKISRVGCTTAKDKTVGNFPGSADFDCNLILSGLPNDGGNAPYIYYARVTPLYNSTTDVKIKAGAAGNTPVKFTGVQSLVDVTAKAGNSVRRLQARIEVIPPNTPSANISPAEDSLPEFGLRAADTLCKRLGFPQNQNSPVVPDPDNKDNCLIKAP